MGLNGKVAVIAGASGGLGRVVTERLAKEGMKLALLSRSTDGLEDLLEDLGLSVSEHFAAAVDLTNPEGLVKIAEGIQEKFGRIDILLNLVGGWAGGETVVDVEAETIQNMLDQHLWTTYHLNQAFVPLLVKNGWGRVLVITSPTATQPGAKSSAYAIGKVAQETLMITLAAELKGSGVTANVIQVKAIDTKHKRDADDSGKYAGWTTPEEIASAIVYFSGEEAGQLNGIRLPLYG
jgi:NAD(P)-dependent dehydrogenase (short-subunit alcohol dehydrogenase family)